MPTITIGIATYNRHAILKKCIEHILKQEKKPDEVIIVDSTPDEFTDSSLESLKKFCRTTYLKQASKTPLPKGRNIILSKCSTDIISFIDDDSIVRSDFVLNVIRSFMDPLVGGVTGPTINSNINLEAKVRIIRDNLPRSFVTPWGDVYSDTRRWIPHRNIICGSMIGANMSYRKNIIQGVGGFDENFTNPSFREDTDPQIMIRRMGFNFLYNPNVFVNHVTEQAGGIEDIEEKRREYFFMAGQNHRYFCDKHYPKWITRLSWIFFNRTPPNLVIATLLTFIKKDNYLMWHKGLWFKNDTTHRGKE